MEKETRSSFIGVLAALIYCSSLGLSSGACATEDPAFFKNGAEVFQMQTAAGKPLTLQLLSDTPEKQALAMALTAALNSSPETNPKIPMQDHLDAILQSVTLTPDGADLVAVRVKLSGHDLNLPKKVDRNDFIHGKKIALVFDPIQKTVAIFDLKFRGGTVNLHWDSSKHLLLIDEAKGQLEFESALMGSGCEKIHFTGQGKRVLK